MKKLAVLTIIFLSVTASLPAQEAQDANKEAVKRTVETYLFAEESEEREQIISRQARIFSIAPDGKIAANEFTRAKKKSKGAKIFSLQKVVNIEIEGGAAVAKVETDLSSSDAKIPKHYQFISLLKTNGEWKIVSVLMPPVTVSPQ